jgi:cell division protein FtsW (lipid II flippase)
MYDFGTALIFFFTFIVIAFMRSGDIRTIVLICTIALMGGLLVLMFRPYVANRFAAYGHVWEYFDTSGYQQTRTMIYSASGGLFGVGLGNGKLRDIKKPSGGADNIVVTCPHHSNGLEKTPACNI